MINWSLRWRLILSYVGLVVVCISSLGLVLYFYMQRTYLDLIRNNLLGDARLISSQIDSLLQQGPPYDGLQNLAESYHQKLGMRITIMLPNGKVISDTSYDPIYLENHRDRPEMLKALNGSEGSQIRYSNTLKVDMLYVAVPVRWEEQVIGVARVALPMSELKANMATARRMIFLGSLVTTILAVVLSILMTHYTILPLRKLTETVAKLMNRIPQVTSAPSAQQDEINQLDQAFNLISHQLSQQINQLRAEHDTLTAVLSYMNDGILIVDPDGMIQLINTAAQQIFGVSQEQAVNHRLIEVVRQHQLVEIWQKSRLTGTQQSTTLETAPDRLFLQGIATPLGGEMPGSTLLVIQDLTRLRRLEMVRRDFVSNVSHELRTPLASLKALTETLSEGALEDLPAARKFLVRMEDEIDNMTQMVQELLELSRIESGRVPLEKQTIAPCDLIQPAIERMQLQAQRAGLLLTSECPGDMPRVLADPSRMEQVLVNLVHNAIKFTPPGGKITISAYPEHNNVVFSVRDTGVGIEPDVLERIFERFYKGDRSRSGGGTGLGLSIARHLVETHGGRIWAESTPNQGSTFYFSLPVA